MLGKELGTALLQRRTAERRSILAQRGTLGPDDSPYQHHTFDPCLEYRGVEWGHPVPQEEWERRVYVELNLATDLRYEGKGAPPECHACRCKLRQQDSIWKFQLAWPWSIPYALHTLDWKPDHTPTSPTSVSTGRIVLEPCLDPLDHGLDLGNQATTNRQDYRWIPSQQGRNQCAFPDSTWQLDWLPSTNKFGGTLENRRDEVGLVADNRLDYRWALRLTIKGLLTATPLQY
eukprot:5737718-Amphidinium_carterae.1